MRSGTIVLLHFQDGPRYGRVPWVKPTSAELRETAETAQDWWGEAPDLPFRVSKAAEVVESVIGRVGKPPSRGPGAASANDGGGQIERKPGPIQSAG